jgi:hypothetical protein
MAIPKKYFHDRLILLLLSINTFLVILIWPLVLLKLGGGRQGSYIVQYRSNLGVSAFQTGSVWDLLAFLAFAVLVYVIHFVMSVKAYRVRQKLAVAILALGLLLEILTLIVSNALLALH